MRYCCQPVVNLLILGPYIHKIGLESHVGHERFWLYFSEATAVTWSTGFILAPE